jgi:transcriptional regulator with XRE-family HTH domain
MTKLSQYLEQGKLTQGAFALRLGVTQATVSRLVSGKAKPGLELAVAIERTTGGKVPVGAWAMDSRHGASLCDVAPVAGAGSLVPQATTQRTPSGSRQHSQKLGAAE